MTDLTKYQRLSEISHILTRSGMYLGSTTNTQTTCFVVKNGKMVEETLTYSPALLKMFDEIISNSVDEHIRSGNVTKIEVDLFPLTGEIRISDNGGIPVKIHPVEQVYIPSLIFGELRTGSNFSDEERFSAGLNGLGSKLTSVFSTEFKVETMDGSNYFVQVFKNNLSDKLEPSIKPCKEKGTTITFTPDYRRLGCSLDESNMKRIEKRVYDVAGCNPKIKVFFNGKEIKTNQFKDYVSMYVDESVEDSNEHWTVSVAANDEDTFKHVSFVNGVDTFNGGSHVDYIVNQITTKLRDFIKKKHKVDVKPNNIKQQLFLFINSKINAPMFTSQTKEFMSTDVKDFGTSFEVTDKFLNKIIKSDVVQRVLDWAESQERQKELAEIRKLKNKKKVHKSDKYLPAIKENKVLIAGEGQSALGSLIPTIGRDIYGYYELKGKPLNSINASVSKFKDNKELSELFTILSNEGYEYFLVGSDQDLDGLHIRILMVAFIHTYMPQFKNRFGYIDTPVMVIKNKGKIKRWFYSLRDNVKLEPGDELQYFKGIGTWDFKDLKYIIEKDGLDSMVKIFDMDDMEPYLDWLKDDRVETRKELLSEHSFNIAKL